MVVTAIFGLGLTVAAPERGTGTFPPPQKKYFLPPPVSHQIIANVLNVDQI